MDDFKTRLMDYARKSLDMGQVKFEEHCGLSRGTINKFGPKGPSALNLQKILRACTDLNARWLITGEGEMLEGQAPSSTPTPMTDIHGNVMFIGNWDGLTPILEKAIDKALKK